MSPAEYGAQLAAQAGPLSAEQVEAAGLARLAALVDAAAEES